MSVEIKMDDKDSTHNNQVNKALLNKYLNKMFEKEQLKK